MLTHNYFMVDIRHRCRWHVRAAVQHPLAQSLIRDFVAAHNFLFWAESYEARELITIRSLDEFV